jgi:hypothetical protein
MGFIAASRMFKFCSAVTALLEPFSLLHGEKISQVGIICPSCFFVLEIWYAQAFSTFWIGCYHLKAES